jgi:hypothetical protein
MPSRTQQKKDSINAASTAPESVTVTPNKKNEMTNQILPQTSANVEENALTSGLMRAAARDLITKADRLEMQLFQESGTRFWDIPSYGDDETEGVLLEQHEPGRLVEYRVVPKMDHNAVGAEWDSNAGEPQKNRVYPPEFVFKSIAAVSLVSKLADVNGNESSRYVEA